MNITVFLKPALSAEALSLLSTSKPMLTPGMELDLEKADKSSLELALRLKESRGAEVVAMTIGGPDTEILLLTSLAMGADRGIRLEGHPDRSPLEIARSLADAAAACGTDYLFTGMETSLPMLSSAAAAAAELLGMPYVGGAVDIESTDQGLQLVRRAQNRRQRILLPPRCAVAVRGVISARYMHAARIFSPRAECLTVSEPGRDDPGQRLSPEYEWKNPKRAQRVVEGTEEELVQEILRFLESTVFAPEGRRPR